MQLIPNQQILYGQEVKPVSDPSPFRIKVSAPWWSCPLGSSLSEQGLLGVERGTYYHWIGFRWVEQFVRKESCSASNHFCPKLFRTWCSTARRIFWRRRRGRRRKIRDRLRRWDRRLPAVEHPGWSQQEPDGYLEAAITWEVKTIKILKLIPAPIWLVHCSITEFGLAPNAMLVENGLAIPRFDVIRDTPF